MDLPKRKYPRASFLDYNDGLFFVTICTAEKRHYFGFIRSDEMYLSAIGRFTDECIRGLTVHYPDAKILNYVIMPNHVHLILEITGVLPDITEKSMPTDAGRRNYGQLDKLKLDSLAKNLDPALSTHHDSRLAVAIGGMKSAVSRFARNNQLEFGWQRNFHDHLIRGNRDGDRIWNYIDNNVINWDKDCFNEE